MAIDFPNSPSVNQTFTSGSQTWQWSGTVWNLVIQPLVGPTGATGPTGAASNVTGPTGPTGSAGEDGQFSTVAATPPSNAFLGDAWFNAQDGHVYVYYDGYWVESASSIAGATGPQGVTGPTGAAGVNGIGIAILGSFANLAALQAAHPTGSPGDGYLVEGDLYVWDDTNSEWDNVGSIQGPTGATGAASTVTGPTGAVGETGPTGPTGAEGAASTVTGPTGATGPTGSQGQTGLTGVLYQPTAPTGAGTSSLWYDTDETGISTVLLPYYKDDEGHGSAAIDVISRQDINGVVSSVSGTAYYTFFTPLESITVSQLTLASAATAAATVTTVRAGLYIFDESTTTATLVARIANDTNIFTAANTSYTRSFSTAGGYPDTYTLTAGVRYCVGVVVVATTMPTIVAADLGVSAAGVAAISPRISAAVADQSDLPVAPNSFTNTSYLVWSRLS